VLNEGKLQKPAAVEDYSAYGVGQCTRQND
jgi:hypothetical protein